MSVIEIKHRWSGAVLYVGEHDTLRLAVEGANLGGADPIEANLGGADLIEANLRGADLRGSDLRRSDLRRADLSGADLSGADLSGADLRGADLSGADLSRADLSGADLRGANLRGADLRAIREDFRSVLDAAPNEVSGLRLALVEGRIDGSTYSGECACLVGTIANIKDCNYHDFPGIIPDSSRPAERFFLAIDEGNTPGTSQPAKIVLGWIDEWIADRAAVATTAQA
jgi:uncharacterized protein YjbI with pentapeptide repeats